MIVAFASVSSIETFDVGSAKTLDKKFDIIGLSPALTSAANNVAKTRDLGVVDIDVGQSQKGGHGLLRRIAEISSHDVSENVVTRTLG
jgi:hypothetical protein